MFDTPSGPFVAVKDVNAVIGQGEFVCILGHSGCGKSTVLSIIAGLEQATFGGVVIDGKQVTAPGPERAVVFQSPCLLPWLTARENVQLAADRADARGRRSAEATDAKWYLDLVGVGDDADQLPAELSLGTQQCVSLARALSVEPRFLLLDEPFSMLDSLTRFELQDTLLDVWEQQRRDGRDGDARHRRGALPRRSADPDDGRSRSGRGRNSRGPVCAAAAPCGRSCPSRRSQVETAIVSHRWHFSAAPGSWDNG